MLIKLLNKVNTAVRRMFMLVHSAVTNVNTYNFWF